ncbi:hypothetical protein ANOM_000196 [Aspergillus nomiae NRRL 13137]|uniref:EXPERA domain-containing protein n=1 Tax=Aspergillus nomiae NRRL (strain ATCC 15546 / NRRL 13137 / CBS 260.88 / M93) TaxID=1509407 RepID=A0A0L1JJ00_ASPN3|nr:uncharacterized protein ANOM_000196 [Aspergillus nomiae NRRL 13137]KNG91687.1 hypothetical protein ANOM_000196 [Aspergillus nomiae NRRL 13137]
MDTANLLLLVRPRDLRDTLRIKHSFVTIEPKQVCKAWIEGPFDQAIGTKDRTSCYDHVSPHLSLFFTTSDNSQGEGRAAINIKSGDKSDSRLVFWLVKNFENFQNERLRELKPGFHLLEGTMEQAPNGLALDYIRGNLFHRETGRLLPHDIPGPDNDILDELIPVLDGAVDHDSVIYIFGSHFNTGNGIHNVHMNQGSPKKWKSDNGIYQDGGILLDFGDHWKGVFIGFASQAVHTDAEGQPTPPRGYLSWNELLNPEIPGEQRQRRDVHDRTVTISEAMIRHHGSDPTTKSDSIVTLTNRADAPVILNGWSVRNHKGENEYLPDGAVLRRRRRQSFQLHNCALSDEGGTITLLNEQGLKVDESPRWSDMEIELSERLCSGSAESGEVSRPAATHIRTGFIHLFFEAYFVIHHETLAGSQELFGQLWKEYSLSDSRYLTSDAFLVTMEAVTAFCWGPLAFFIAYCIAVRHPARHALQLLLSVGQVYGDVLYYATSLFDHYFHGGSFCRPEGYYFWFYYFFFNFIWMVIGSYYAKQSVGEIYRAFKKVQQFDSSSKRH